MTKAQRKAHKMGNQRRKAAILKLRDNRTGKRWGGGFFKVGQDSKYSTR